MLNGKTNKSLFKLKNKVSISRPLELLHLDLFGPITPTSLDRKTYAFVIFYDYSRFFWIFFLAHKDETFNVFEIFCKRVQNEKSYYITSSRSDYEKNLRITYLIIFCKS